MYGEEVGDTLRDIECNRCLYRGTIQHTCMATASPEQMNTEDGTAP